MHRPRALGPGRSPSCLLCDVGLFAGLVCEPCSSTLRELRLPPGRGVKLGLGPDYPSLEVRCHSAYVGSTKTLIHQLKFQSRLESAALWERAPGVGLGGPHGLRHRLSCPDILSSLAERSYNPAALLAEQVVLHQASPCGGAFASCGRAPRRHPVGRKSLHTDCSMWTAVARSY